MEITKHEIIISVAIAAVMLIIGYFISGRITDMQNDKNAEYQKAVHIETSNLLRYGMDTNVGNAFVYGDLQAVDTVTFDEVGGKYLYIEKVKERYERHEREVTVTDSNGIKHTKTEVYYEWETEDSEVRHSENIRFCGIEFPYEKIPYSLGNYIETIKSGREYSWKSGEFVKVRFKYYGTSTKHTGTIYTKLSDGTISDNSRFFRGYTIEQALDKCTSNFGSTLFWSLWITLTVGAVIGFCYFDNKWLED